MNRPNGRRSNRRHLVRNWEPPVPLSRRFKSGEPFHQTIEIIQGRKRHPIEVKLHVEWHHGGGPAQLVVCAHPRTALGKVIKGYGLRPAANGRPAIPKEVKKRVGALRDRIRTEEDVSELPVVYDFALR